MIDSIVIFLTGLACGVGLSVSIQSLFFSSGADFPQDPMLPPSVPDKLTPQAFREAADHYPESLKLLDAIHPGEPWDRS